MKKVHTDFSDVVNVALGKADTIPKSASQYFESDSAKDTFSTSKSNGNIKYIFPVDDDDEKSRLQDQHFFIRYNVHNFPYNNEDI